MSPLYVFIDTNIWIRVISQGKPGCELPHLETLSTLVDQGQLVLVLPEIVELELEKLWREFKDDVVKHVGQIEKKLEDVFKPQLWTEIEDLRTAIGAFLQQQKQTKITTAEANYKRIQQLFASAKIVKIPLTSDLLFLGKKRLISGRMPITENKAHNDACIIESMNEYFKTTNNPETVLCFCSENITDFGLKTKDELVLHPLVKDGLPPTKYVTNLRELMAFHESNAKVHEPPEAEIEEALEERVKASSVTLEEICSELNCNEPLWIIGPFCHTHFQEHYQALSQSEKAAFQQTLETVLKTLTYREREVLKLRTGLGDGYVYTRPECGRIFKCSVATIRRAEAKALRKLQHPVRAKALAEFF